MRRALVFLFVTSLIFAVTGPVAAGPPESEPVTILAPAELGFAHDELVFELAANPAMPEVAIESYGDTAELLDRLTGDDPPDLIITQQPGAIHEVAEFLVGLDEFVNPRSLVRDYGAYLIDAATVDGIVYGAPILVDLKSLVWYRPDAFAANGYSVPQSFDELVALSDTMVANGQVPWTNYIESGAATGWMGTDWIEDLLLSAEGPEVYDQWVEHTVLFTDPRVEAAFTRYQQMVDTPGYVFDRANMLNIFFAFNAVPLGDGDVMMHKQASFFGAFIGDFGYDIADFATFRFPSVNPEFADTVMGGGSYIAAATDSHDVRALVRFITSHRFGRAVIADASGWVLPNLRFDTDRYADDLTRSWAVDANAAIAAGQFRFDASDLMPPEVGSGTFFTGIVDLVAGIKTIPEVLIDIDASWPS